MTSREEWRLLEIKHFGQCVWQRRAPNPAVLIEGLIHRATGLIVIVEKLYAKRLPRSGSRTPWPELETVTVYLPINDKNTWENLDAALEQFGKVLP